MTQGDDEASRRLAEGWERGGSEVARGRVRVRALHSDRPGIVAAENLALGASTGEVVLLIDDDAEAPRDWVSRHLGHYADDRVGAVGGPAVNWTAEGERYPVSRRWPRGRLTWWGRVLGNMHDRPEEERGGVAEEVDHLVGYNLSFRRSAIDRFAEDLRAYWQLFELEACLQVKARGYRVMYDPGIVVAHHPSNAVYADGREGDAERKVLNPAYNHAYILGKHFRGFRRWGALGRAMVLGTTAQPGLAGALASWRRYGNAVREARLAAGCARARWEGYRAGRRAAGGSG